MVKYACKVQTHKYIYIYIDLADRLYIMTSDTVRTNLVTLIISNELPTLN